MAGELMTKVLSRPLEPLKLVDKSYDSGRSPPVLRPDLTFVHPSGETWETHGAILAWHSNLVHWALLNQPRPLAFSLEDISPLGVSTVLDFCRKGQAMVEFSNIQEVFQAAKNIGVSAVCQALESYLDSLGSSDSEGLALLSLDVASSLSVSSRSLRCISAKCVPKFEALRRHEDFKRLKLESVCLLLEQESLNESEVEIFRSAMEWLEANPDEVFHIDRLLRPIKFTSMTPTGLENCLEAAEKLGAEVQSSVIQKIITERMRRWTLKHLGTVDWQRKHAELRPTKETKQDEDGKTKVLLESEETEMMAEAAGRPTDEEASDDGMRSDLQLHPIHDSSIFVDVH